jgi:beta-glucosidase
LFPFGYGLSYADFEYSDLQLSGTQLTAESSITVSITVKNVGKYTGKETVQLYIRDLVGSVVRPVKELKGFKQVSIMPGEATTVSFELSEEMLRFHRADMLYASELGEFQVMVGRNSENLLTGSFTLAAKVES